MTKHPILIQDCDESQLLTKIFPTLPTNSYVSVGPGDDCAVVLAPNSQFVVSTDILIQDQHFRTTWSTGADVGWRAAVQNFADIAAMGAVPSTVVLALGLPGQLPLAWLESFYEGFNAACDTVGAAVVGGDLSASEIITVAVTVHGDMQGLDPVLRSGAKPGDVIAHSGQLGWAAAGLAALTKGLPATGAPTTTDVPPLQVAISRFLRPQPTLTLGPVAARAGASALMDVSDGLLRDAARIAQASGVVMALDLPSSAPLELSYPRAHSSNAAGLEEVAELVLETAVGSAQLARKWQLSGGEDHGLLATFPTLGQVPEGFAIIGRVGQQKGQPPVTLNGQDVAGLEQGWDHFR